MRIHEPAFENSGGSFADFVVEPPASPAVGPDNALTAEASIELSSCCCLSKGTGKLTCKIPKETYSPNEAIPIETEYIAPDQLRGSVVRLFQILDLPNASEPKMLRMTIAKRKYGSDFVDGA